MKVKFSAVEEFIEELRLEREDVTDEIVRITCSYQPFKDHPHLMSLTVVAGIVVRGKIVELRKSCGMVCDSRDDTESQKARERADAILETLNQAIEELGLATRKGVFEL